MNVGAIIVTRGDVDLEPIFNSLPSAWERIVWNNGKPELTRHRPGWFRAGWHGDEHTGPMRDLSVYGRYAAIEHALDSDLIYVQDDDVIVSEPATIAAAWQPGTVVCNMPPEFRHDGYTDSALVGFGACFAGDLPEQAFERFGATVPKLGLSNYGWSLPGTERFNRTCDVVFTALTPRILVDVPKTDREFASDPGRMWTTPGHVEERTRMLELARKVRDA